MAHRSLLSMRRRAFVVTLLICMTTMQFMCSCDALQSFASNLQNRKRARHHLKRGTQHQLPQEVPPEGAGAGTGAGAGAGGSAASASSPSTPSPQSLDRGGGSSSGGGGLKEQAMGGASEAKQVETSGFDINIFNATLNSATESAAASAAGDQPVTPGKAGLLRPNQGNSTESGSDDTEAATAKPPEPHTGSLDEMSQPAEVGELKVTASLISWKRVDNLSKLLANLAKFKFIKEVVVWNNNADIKIKAKDYSQVIQASFDLVVVNSNVNLNNRARFEACKLARYSVCYFQDDDFVPSVLNSLYESFKQNPAVINTVTTYGQARTDALLAYFNPQIKLHTQFAYIGVGAFAAKSLVTTFLGQLDKTVDKALHFCSDLFFTTFANEVPVVLTADDAAVGEKKSKKDKDVAYSGEDKFDKCVMQAHINRTTILVAKLQGHDPLFSDKFASKEYAKRTARALCASDKCIFDTSVAHWELNDKDLFNPGDEEKFLARIYHAPDAQGKRKPIKLSKDIIEKSHHDPLHAVDFDEKSYWQPPQNVKSGDSYGLTLVDPLQSRTISVTFSHSGDLQKSLAVQSSSDGHNWSPLQVTPGSVQETSGPSRLNKIEYTLPQPSPTTHIRFSAPKNVDEPFKVHEIRLTGDDNPNRDPSTTHDGSSGPEFGSAPPNGHVDGGKAPKLGSDNKGGDKETRNHGNGSTRPQSGGGQGGKMAKMHGALNGHGVGGGGDNEAAKPKGDENEPVTEWEKKRTKRPLNGVAKEGTTSSGVQAYQLVRKGKDS